MSNDMNVDILAGMLSTQNFQNKHPQLAKQWLEVNADDIIKALSSNKANTGCESCEGTGRIEVEPDSEYTHPCDICQPEALEEFNRGVAAERGLAVKHGTYQRDKG